MLRFLNRHKLLLAALAVSAMVGVAAAKFNTRANLTVGAAATHVMIDYPDASIADRVAFTQDLSTLQKRAELYGRLIVTPPVLELVAKRAGVARDQVSAVARTTADVPIPLLEPGSEERASQIRDSWAPYRLELQSDSWEPILSIYSEAPSTDEALRLADAAILGLGDHLERVAREQGFPQSSLPQLIQLGPARGGVTNGKAAIIIGSVTFVCAFSLTLVGLLLVIALWRRATGRHVDKPEPRSRLTGRAAADWPRTSRVLPWSVAVLIFMFWLTPFDKIQLSMPTPIDITLDRMLLPLVVVIWLIAFTAGAGAAPRVRITKVHVALFGFLAVAFLSVVFDARYLNQTGELMLAFKKLPLMFSYIVIFVIVASSVRKTEVPAFMTYTLVLAVICGLGVMYEYKFSQNPFLTVSGLLAKGPLELVSESTGSGLDSLGRRWVQGPAGYGVELVTMMTMALPIAVLGILRSKSRQRQLLYAFAIVVLLAAMFATQRKSALLAPAAAILVLGYFRRRELLSLAPLGLVVGVLVAALSPQAVKGVVGQFTRSDAGQVATVSDRTADYDAVRPDMWTHLLFGRGHGTYTHTTYRILDSEILSRIVETGLAGLAAFLLISLSVVVVGRKTVSARDPRWSPAALCGVSAAICFIVVGTLYDVMAYPHAPDVFLYLAGMVVAVTGPDNVRSAFAARRSQRPRARRARGAHAAPEPVAAR